MDKNTQQPVAWLVFRSATEYELFISEYNAMQRAKQLGSTAVQPLYTAPPMPRDVLMAVAEAAFLNGHQNANGYEPRDIDAIVDTYASQAQPDPVNQQLLAALKRLLHKAYKQNWQDNYPSEVECAEAAIDAAMQK